MLYIFHVDKGTMMTFDMNLALESVASLRNHVEKIYKIPASKQVLLVSGGESLNLDARVCSYSAGTDTNPIYLFSKSVIESTTPPCPSLDAGPDTDLGDKVKLSAGLPPTYSTVATRASLAQQFLELSKSQTQTCERLVYDQHLQHQGWAAAVANLEDITAEFAARAAKYSQAFESYLETRESYLQYLQSFDDDRKTLAKIPVLRALLDLEADQSAADASKADAEETPSAGGGSSSSPGDGGAAGADAAADDAANAAEADAGSTSSFSTSTTTTLLDWISTDDSHNTLGQIAEISSRGLEQINAKVVETLKTEVDSVLSAADKVEMKEIKNIGERLSKLETLLNEAKSIVQEQVDLAQAFIQNQNRASNLGDLSILPDLCASHQQQLHVMQTNHEKLRNIRSRCSNAKKELSSNLYHRLKWIMYVQNKILETNSKLMIYHDSLKRLRKHLEIVQQIHLAPTVYLSAVGEVVRRRAFSQAFLLWASELACHLLTIYNDEVARRKDFQSQFEGHFLNSLFPGMNDLPPSFATQAPSIFDSSLPKLTSEDIQQLKTALPDLASQLVVPDLSAIASMFTIRPAIRSVDSTDDRDVEEKCVQAVSDVGLASNLDKALLKPATSDQDGLASPIALPILKDLDRGCESETDTEEFEKVGQSPMETHHSAAKLDGKQDTSTSTQELVQDTLQAVGDAVLSRARATFNELRSEAASIRLHLAAERTCVSSRCSELGRAWQAMAGRFDEQEKEILRRVTVAHELELSDVARAKEAAAEELSAQIRQLEERCVAYEARLAEMERSADAGRQEQVAECDALRKKLEEQAAERAKAVREVSEKLSNEFKTEMASLRARFKLMTVTSMERSPSESSLEKVERSEVIETVHHEAILAQVRKDLKEEKEREVASALEAERSRWEARLALELTQARVSSEANRQVLFNEAMKRVVDEKEKQIDALREREAALSLECLKCKNTIQQLAENSLTSNSSLLERIDCLERDKCQLEAELSVERSRRLEEEHQEQQQRHQQQQHQHQQQDLAASFTVISESSAGHHGPVSPPMHGMVSVTRCNAGDAVLVVWDAQYRNYLIRQASDVLYFLHPNCFDALGLKPAGIDLADRTMYAFAEVVSVQSCRTAKRENRYHLPMGKTFKRVTVKPLSCTAKGSSMPAEQSRAQGAPGCSEGGQISAVFAGQLQELRQPAVDLANTDCGTQKELTTELNRD